MHTLFYYLIFLLNLYKAKKLKNLKESTYGYTRENFKCFNITLYEVIIIYIM